MNILNIFKRKKHTVSDLQLERIQNELDVHDHKIKELIKRLMRTWPGVDTRFSPSNVKPG